MTPKRIKALDEQWADEGALDEVVRGLTELLTDSKKVPGDKLNTFSQHVTSTDLETVLGKAFFWRDYADECVGGSAYIGTFSIVADVQRDHMEALIKQVDVVDFRVRREADIRKLVSYLGYGVDVANAAVQRGAASVPEIRKVAVDLIADRAVDPRAASR